MMKLIRIYEAKESRDKKFRKEATDFYSKLQRYISFERNVEELVQNMTGNYGGYVLDAGKIDSRYKKLLIFLIPSKIGSKGVAGGYGKNKKKQDVILLPVLKGPFDVTYLNTRMGGSKKVFVHEFIHYLDDRRTKTEKGVGVASKHKGKTISDKEYYNNPKEFNAFYQEGSNEIEEFFTSPRISLWAKTQIMGKNFDQFMKNTGKFFADGYVESLNSKNRKKFLQRLYGLYESLKDKM